MSITANKGEHSETLVFLRILHEGTVRVADKLGEPGQSRLKVAAIKRPSDPGMKFHIQDEMIHVVDVTGKIVYSSNEGTQNNGSHKLNIDASTFTNGVYYVTVSTDETQVTKKMIKN